MAYLLCIYILYLYIAHCSLRGSATNTHHLGRVSSSVLGTQLTSGDTALMRRPPSVSLVSLGCLCTHSCPALWEVLSRRFAQCHGDVGTRWRCSMLLRGRMCRITRAEQRFAGWTSKDGLRGSPAREIRKQGCRIWMRCWKQ